MKYSKSAETTRGICVVCSKLLYAAKKKKNREMVFTENGCSQKNYQKKSILISAQSLTFISEKNSEGEKCVILGHFA